MATGTCKDCGDPIETWSESDEQFQGQASDTYHHIAWTTQTEWCVANRPQIEVLPA